MLVVGVLLVMTGLAGIYIAESDLSPTLERGLQQFSTLVLVFGIALVPGGILRGGLPQVSGVKAVAMLTAAVLGVSAVATTAALQIGPFKPAPKVEQFQESPIKTIIRIVPGSFIQTQTQNFVPKTVTVVIGVNNTVIWMNTEEVPVSHTVTHTGGQFDSGLFTSGLNFTYTFGRPGTFNYFCQPHPWMTGTVTSVQSAETA